MKFFFSSIFILTASIFYGSDLTRFEENGKVGFKNFSTGKIEINAQFQAADVFCNGIAQAKLNDKWGFINEKGKWIIEPIYQGTNYFSDGTAPVKLNDKWGFIRENGE